MRHKCVRMSDITEKSAVIEEEYYMYEHDNPFEERFLVITEKPSVAMMIASVLGFNDRKDGYIEGPEGVVSWCFGHLAELVLPEEYDKKYRTWTLDTLPIIPDQWKLKVPRDKMKQFRILCDLLNNRTRKEKSTLSGAEKFLVPFDYVVNAADPGREGEEIFNRVYALSGSRLPVKRLWVSSMEDKAIMEAFLNMKDGSEYKKLGEAATCRAQADWLVGINASRAFTKTYDCRFSVGRVQSPTLAMLVERNDQIAGFRKKQYYVTHLQVDSLGHRIDAVSERFSDREESNRLAGMCNGRMATVPSIERRTRTVSPPKLYDLTTLQRDANRLFGFSASKTLECAQALYEDKLITYPRTDSNYLSDDMEQAAEDILLTCSDVFSFLSDEIDDPDEVEEDEDIDIGCLLDNDKVTDHHAIIPTEEIRRKGYSDCSTDERKILFLIAARLACAVAKPYIYDLIKATFLCCGYSFTAVGKAVKQEGWKAVDTSMRKALLLSDPENPDGSDETTEGNDNGDDGVGADETGTMNGSDGSPSGGRYQDLSSLYQGAQFFPAGTRVTDHWTQPPRPFTEDTLLHAMESAGTAEMDSDVERKGLGTPATRAGIIDKLVSSRYAVRKNRQIIATEEGKKLISVLPDYLKSAKMTSDWENRLLLIERGEYDRKEFMDGIASMLRQMLAECRQISADRNHLSDGSSSTDPLTGSAGSNATHAKAPREIIGNCPVCGSPLYEGEKNFYCSDRECRFALWKKNRYLDRFRISLDKDMAKDLLAHGRTTVKNLYSAKKDKYFKADLLMEWKDGMPNYSLDFSGKSSGKRSPGKE